MARMGVFSRNDSTPDAVPRSLQLLSHRHSFTTQYMRIVPNFAEILYPNESISLKVTNFIRTIPMQRPMLSRVRVVQRFCAVPLRILWQQWEDYIKGENEAQFLLEEPYIINNGNLGTLKYVLENAKGTDNNSVPLSSLFQPILGFRTNTNYVSRDAYWDNTFSNNIPQFRGITLDKNSYVPDSFRNPTAYFAPRELGDYFGAPLFQPLGKLRAAGDVAITHPFSAFKFAAYQLAYSYFDRQTNVQSRVDDFYELSKTGKYARGLSSSTTEFSPAIGLIRYNDSGLDEDTPYEPVIDKAVKIPVTSSKFFEWNLSDAMIGTRESDTSLYVREDLNRDIAANIDSSSDTYQQDVIRSSWENVEKFPLKGGANMSMLAWYNDPSSGIPKAVPSNISLSRIRYANWQTDYFTSCNPWQQRGEEAQIPVSGIVSVDFSDGITATFTGTPGTAVGSLDISNNRLYFESLDGDDFVAQNATNAFVEDGGFSDVNLEVYNPSSSTSQLSSGAKVYTKGTISSSFTPEGTVSIKGSSSSASVAGLYVSPSNFRFAMTLQHIKEMQAQIDNRYQSYIHKFFGARARDFRLDRPEFLGGSVFELNVSDVTQTSETTETSNLADVAGKSVTADTSRTIRYHADEHCVILGTIHIIPDTEYINGLSRTDSTEDRFDWALPQFGHLSEQAVYNRELAYNYGSEADEVFGYEPIYNHLRWRKNIATCDFRDVVNFTGNREEYKPWLQVKDYGALVSVSPTSTIKFRFKVPTLSDQFLSGRYNRDNSNFVVTDDELVFPFMVDSYFNERVVRIIPTRGTPTRLGA